MFDDQRVPEKYPNMFQPASQLVIPKTTLPPPAVSATEAACTRERERTRQDGKGRLLKHPSICNQGWGALLFRVRG